MPDVPENIVGGRPPRNPFRADHLPLIARLCRIGFHRYRCRWAKRLGKRPGRLLFDVAYHGLRLGGRGTISLALADGPKRLAFDARKIHFRGIYDGRPDGHEPEVAAILETLLTGDGAFYDVGANWGYFALYAATVPGYTGAIHAFEPIADTFADLEDLTRQAGLAARVHCHRLALSDRDGDANMTFDPLDTGLSRFARAGRGDVPVKRARLDGLGLPPPALMKVDVEGHELEALQGGEALLKRHKPFIVFENWIAKDDPPSTLAPLRFLESLGYVLYLPVRPAGGGALFLSRFEPAGRFRFPDQINALACHRDRAGELGRAFSGTNSAGGRTTDLR